MSKRCFWTAALFSTIIFQPVFGQKADIDEPQDIARMVDRWAELNRLNPYAEGWRVQLLSTTDRQKAEAAKADFLAKHPDIPADWAQEKPYYKLRAGAFSTKLEALGLAEDLRAEHPGAYPSRDARIPARDFLETKF